MSERRNENWLASFIEYSSYGEAPEKMLFWTGVSTIAGALRRRVWIEQKYFQWTPCFYVILVAPPGIVSKSTTANIGINLLRDVPGIKFGPDIITWQALVESLAKASSDEHDIATGIFYPMSALTICSDEFGTLLDPNNREMVDAFVSLWDGKKGVFSKITKTSGSDSVVNPWVNLLACTTPGWIAAHFPESMVGGGFTSRCIFVYADRKRQYVAYPGNVIPENFEQQREDLVHDLEIISKMIGEFVLDDEAEAWGMMWYDFHWKKKRPEHLDNDRFGGYLARKQTHIHKLAMVLSASESSELVITRKHLEIASALISSLEKDMPRVFATIGQSDITRNHSVLVQIVLQKRSILKIDLYRLMFRTMTVKDFENAVESARLAGYLRVESQQGNVVLVALEPNPQAGD